MRHFLPGHVDRSQAWCGKGRGWRVVIGNDGQVVRHADTDFLEVGKGADGHFVVGAEQCRAGVARLDQFARSIPAARGRKIAFRHPQLARVDAVAFQFFHEAGDALAIVEEAGRPGDDGDLAMLVLQQGLGRQHAALRVVDREALIGNLGDAVVQQYQPALLGPEHVDVFFLQRAAHDDQAVAAAVKQELDAFSGLAPLVAEPHAEGQHHVQIGGPQFGIDHLQHGRVKRAGEYRNVHAYHLAIARKQGPRRMRRAEFELLDGFFYPGHGGRRDRTLPADDA